MKILSIVLAVFIITACYREPSVKAERYNFNNTITPIISDSFNIHILKIDSLQKLKIDSVKWIIHHNKVLCKRADSLKNDAVRKFIHYDSLILKTKNSLK